MSTRSVEEYLKMPYTIEVIRDDNPENPGWVARVVELPGCITQGDTFSELGEMIEDAMRNWIEVALEDGEEIPEPRREEFSGKFIVRVPKSLHRRLVLAAEREGISLNQFVSTVLASAVGLSAAGDPPASAPSPGQIRAWIEESVHRAMQEHIFTFEARPAEQARQERAGPLWEGMKVMVLEQAQVEYSQKLEHAGTAALAAARDSFILDSLLD